MHLFPEFSNWEYCNCIVEFGTLVIPAGNIDRMRYNDGGMVALKIEIKGSIN